MTVPSTAFPVLQMSAISRAEGLRRLEIFEINKVLDEYTDTHSLYNASLTGRERICRLANELESVTDLAQEVKIEINDIVKKLRRAFKLQHEMPYSTTYDLIRNLVNELSGKYPGYDISGKLRTGTRFASKWGVKAIKAEAALMVSELIVIGMNADGEGFREDLDDTIQKMMKIMLSWM